MAIDEYNPTQEVIPSDIVALEVKHSELLDGRGSLTQSTELFLKACSDIIWCPDKTCGFLFERAGKSNDCTEILREDGQKGSCAAADHFNEYRFRCRKCEKDFCSNCNLIPYHKGFTCQEYKERKNSILCRFCEEPLLDGNQLFIGSEGNLDNYHCSNCEIEAHCCGDETFPSCSHASHFDQNYSYENQFCLNSSCVSSATDQCLDDFCAICGTEALRRFPLVQLKGCKHIFHQKCLQSRFETSSSPISLGVYNCPLCNVPVENGVCSSLLTRAEGLREDLKLRIPVQLADCKIDIKRTPKDSDYIAEALRKLNYYKCFKCKSVYFGGIRECGEQIELPEEEMICGGCTACPTHGDEQMIFKCRFCCSVATYFCFGHTHFCTPCHDRAWDLVNGNNYFHLKGNVPVCPGKEECPLKIVHPPNGEEFVLGCGACRDYEASGEVFDPNFKLDLPKPIQPAHIPNIIDYGVDGGIIHNPADDFYARRQKKEKRNFNANRFLPQVEENPVKPKFVSNRIANLMQRFQM